VQHVAKLVVYTDTALILPVLLKLSGVFHRKKQTNFRAPKPVSEFKSFRTQNTSYHGLTKLLKKLETTGK